VIPGDDEERALERPQERGGALVLRRTVPVREVAARHDELGIGLSSERSEVAFHLGLLPRAGV
jgi:hypothetical protein